MSRFAEACASSSDWIRVSILESVSWRILTDFSIASSFSSLVRIACSFPSKVSDISNTDSGFSSPSWLVDEEFSFLDFLFSCVRRGGDDDSSEDDERNLFFSISFRQVSAIKSR